MSSRVHEAVKAIALCHNVTPVYESNGVTDQAEAEKQYEDSCRVYQASSPDEVILGDRCIKAGSCSLSPGFGVLQTRGCVPLVILGLSRPVFPLLPSKPWFRL